MKHFVYIVEKRKNDYYGNPRNLMNVYQLVKGEYKLLTEKKLHIGYRDNNQACIEFLIEQGLMPKKALKKEGNSFRLIDSLWKLKEDKIVSITELR